MYIYCLFSSLFNVHCFPFIALCLCSPTPIQSILTEGAKNTISVSRFSKKKKKKRNKESKHADASLCLLLVMHVGPSARRMLCLYVCVIVPLGRFYAQYRRGTYCWQLTYTPLFLLFRIRLAYSIQAQHLGSCVWCFALTLCHPTQQPWRGLFDSADLARVVSRILRRKLQFY